MEQAAQIVAMACRLFSLTGSFALRLNDSCDYLISDAVFGPLLSGLLGVVILILLLPIFFITEHPRPLRPAFVLTVPLLLLILCGAEHGNTLNGIAPFQPLHLLTGFLGFLVEYGVFFVFYCTVRFVRDYFEEGEEPTPAPSAAPPAKRQKYIAKSRRVKKTTAPPPAPASAKRKKYIAQPRNRRK